MEGYRGLCDALAGFQGLALQEPHVLVPWHSALAISFIHHYVLVCYEFSFC